MRKKKRKRVRQNRIRVSLRGDARIPQGLELKLICNQRMLLRIFEILSFKFEFNGKLLSFWSGKTTNLAFQ